VLFGATGFTGRLAAKYLATQYGRSINWAIAGRNQQRLNEVRADLVKINAKCKDVPILIADSSNVD
jgi:saccharopine dehydrogenase (NAD+, L-glutamate forming)